MLSARPSRREIEAIVLEQAAEHLEQARVYSWNNRSRKVNGWATAAAELRRLAAQRRGRNP